MTADLREMGLAAFHTVVAMLSPGEFATVARNPDWDVWEPELPAAAVSDGRERAEPHQLGTLLVSAEVTVELLTALQPTVAETITELNRLRAVVRAAIGADPTLGGTVDGLRYLGCDNPVVVDLKETPSEGRLQLNFVLERAEAEHDPYRSY